jgi:hypothetical protein
LTLHCYYPLNNRGESLKTPSVFKLSPHFFQAGEARVSGKAPAAEQINTSYIRTSITRARKMKARYMLE